MNRCSKCNNELVAGARFCNICGTPVAEIQAAPETPAVQEASIGLKRTIHPEIRRVRPARGGPARSDSLASDAAQATTTGTPDKSGESAGSDAPEPEVATEQQQQKPRPSHAPQPPVIPKTTIEFTSVKVGQEGEKQKSAPQGDAAKPADSAVEAVEAATAPLAHSSESVQETSAPASELTPMLDLPEQARIAPPPVTATITDDDKTVRLPPPAAPDKTVPLPSPNAGASRAPGIIRPIVNSASLRQNTPPPPGQTPPNPMSPLPPVPNTPPAPGESTPQTHNTRFSRPVNTPMPGSLAQDNQRQAEGPQAGPVAARHPVQPPINNSASQQQNRFNAGVPPASPQTPRPSLHEMPTNYHEQHNGSNNGANSTAARQELPLFSPESFAYTSKAAQHWRSSWRDLQNAEAGPAEDVSKGQAEVPAPLANRKDSFLRMRAIRSKQNSEGNERNFGFWVTLFLMVCLIGGLVAYIVYSYLPNTSGAARISQPAGASQPSFNVVGAPDQTFNRGQSLRARGDHFGANDTIQFLLDSTTPVLASNGSPLSIQSDSQGSFDVTILVGKSWVIGAHIISATDTRAKLSAYIDIQVNPDSSPVTPNNKTDLIFRLNGQPVNQLSFTAQIGQPAPPAQRITFTNNSSAVLQWSAAASTDQNLNWLTILDSDFAGQLDISQPHTMGISVNPAGLTVTPTGKAPYKGQIVFTINGKTQLTLRVQLTIIDATPEMVFTPNPLVAKANGGTCQPGATLTLINLGTTVIHWSANPDNPNKIQFVDNSGQETNTGVLQPSGANGDTEVLTLRCSGVKTGDTYVVQVFANSPIPQKEIVQIGG